MTEQAIVARAERFWRAAGRVEPFPRSLESTITWALPLAVLKLPRLGLRELRDCLAQRGIPFTCAGDRRLRAALVARAGQGMVFVEGSDPDDERRFSLAHELAHFLCDYLDPRARALSTLGEPIRDVLDGRRPPRPEERLTALLREVELGLYTHWLERSTDGAIRRAAILESEDRADRLALELLAPARAVLTRLAELGATTPASATTVLTGEFGLPAPHASSYAAFLLARRSASQTFRQWLGIAGCRTSDPGSE